MNEIIPNQIDFIFIDLKGFFIQNLIVYFNFIVGKKNNHSIGPLISNEKGVITLSRELIEKSINKNIIDYPMDYHGTLNDCSHLEIVIFPKKNLERRVDMLKEFFPEISLSFKKMIDTSNNEEIYFYKKFELPLKNHKIIIEVFKKIDIDL